MKAQLRQFVDSGKLYDRQGTGSASSAPTPMEVGAIMGGKPDSKGGKRGDWRGQGQHDKGGKGRGSEQSFNSK